MCTLKTVFKYHTLVLSFFLEAHKSLISPLICVVSTTVTFFFFPHAFTCTYIHTPKGLAVLLFNSHLILAWYGKTFFTSRDSFK